MKFSSQMTGFDELGKVLRTLPDRMEKNVYQSSVLKGANEMKKHSEMLPHLAQENMTPDMQGIILKLKSCGPIKLAQVMFFIVVKHSGYISENMAAVL